MTNNWSPCIAPGMRLQFEAVQDTWVLLYPEGMVKLNPSASAILQRCNGKLTVAAIVADLDAQGLLIDTKKHKLMVPICDRTGQVIEPMLTDQWFVAMSKVAN